MVLKYSLPARFFHWATLLLIVAAWICVEFKGAIGPGLGMTLHKSFGVTLFCLVVIRLVYRLFDSPPPLNIDMPAWQKTGAHLVHWVLYGLILAQPLAGFVMTQVAGYPLSFFGLFEIPVFISGSSQLGQTLSFLHEEVIWNVLLGLVILHVGFALRHQLIKKDKLINRMW